MLLHARLPQDEGSMDNFTRAAKESVVTPVATPKRASEGDYKEHPDVQLKPGIASDKAIPGSRIGSGSVQEAAARGTSGPGGALPHAAAIQKSFGRHDVSSVKAHTDENAAGAAAEMGAEAFAAGDHGAF